MQRTIRLCGVVVCALGSLGVPASAVSQERSRLVDTGVILSAQESDRVEREMRWLGITPPYWTPTPEDIARLEIRLKLYLKHAAAREAKAILAEGQSYKRQYLGFTDGGRTLIYVNSICDAVWKDGSDWRDGLAIFFDGGPCFFQVFYQPSSNRFERLRVNGPWRF